MNKRQLKKYWTVKLREAEEAYTRAEEQWEASPSGEMNESQVPIDDANLQIGLIEEFLETLKDLK